MRGCCVVNNDVHRPTLTLYYREGCHLCEDLEQQLPELLEPGSFALEKIDIDEDETLKQAYNVRVPVLCCDGIEVCEHFLDLDALRTVMTTSSDSSALSLPVRLQ